MAELLTLARPYARAAFDFAQGETQLAAWSGMLACVAALVCEERMRGLLANPAATPARRVALLEQVCGDSLSLPFRRFLQELSERGRLFLLPAIAIDFEARKALHESTIDVSVRSAFALSDAEQQRLIGALSKKLARQVRLQTTVDASLMGGVVIQAGDLFIDGSIAGKLKQLASALVS